MRTEPLVLRHRGPKQPVDPERAYGTAWEEEADGTGRVASTAVVLVTNRECPFHCVMCDLWTHTLDHSPAPGQVARQVARALADLPPARWVKLYNAGSFFDPSAIPPADDEAIAGHVSRFERVVVEAHPAFLAGIHADRCRRFRDMLSGTLEVAIGLETAHADVLARLDKRMTLETFARAAGFLRDEGIALRVFVLLQPPFMRPDESVDWACRSIDLAASSGARVVSIIPTRPTAAATAFAGPAASPPISDLEAVVRYGLSRGDVVTLADLWDIDCFVRDEGDDRPRIARLAAANRTQALPSDTPGLPSAPP